MNCVNIIGIGTDIVSLQRIHALLQSFPQRFPQRILHPQELKIFRQYRQRTAAAAFLARRFAAKEAIVKALGYGFKRIYARQLHVANNEHGAPYLVSPSDSKQDVVDVLISIADEKDYAVAYAIAIRKK